MGESPQYWNLNAEEKFAPLMATQGMRPKIEMA